MSSVRAGWVAHYISEQRRAINAQLDSMVLERMHRVRETVKKRGAEREMPEHDMVVLVGPRGHEGIRLDVVTLDHACDVFPMFAERLRVPIEPGQVRVFAWSHTGYACVRRYRLWRAEPEVPVEIDD